MKADDYAELKRYALLLSDMKDVISVMDKIETLPLGTTGTLTYIRDDGEELADIWWDTKSEAWLCNFRRGSA